jgi:hypothetical protein
MAMANKIADFYDAFRQTFTGGRVLMTAAVDALLADVIAPRSAARPGDAIESSSGEH